MRALSYIVKACAFVDGDEVLINHWNNRIFTSMHLAQPLIQNRSVNRSQTSVHIDFLVHYYNVL